VIAKDTNDSLHVAVKAIAIPITKLEILYIITPSEFPMKCEI